MGGCALDLRTKMLFMPDEVFRSRKLTRVEKGIYLVIHAESVAQGFCRDSPFELYFRTAPDSRLFEGHHHDINKMLEHLQAGRFIRRLQAGWKVHPRLLKKGTRGKMIHVGLWYNQDFSGAEVAVLVCMGNENRFKKRISFLTDAEIAEQSGYTPIAIKIARLGLLKVRAVSKSHKTAKRKIGKSVQTIQGFWLNPNGLILRRGRRGKNCTKEIEKQFQDRWSEVRCTRHSVEEKIDSKQIL